MAFPWRFHPYIDLSQMKHFSIYFILSRDRFSGLFNSWLHEQLETYAKIPNDRIEQAKRFSFFTHEIQNFCSLLNWGSSPYIAFVLFKLDWPSETVRLCAIESLTEMGRYSLVFHQNPAKILIKFQSFLSNNVVPMLFQSLQCCSKLKV